MLNIQLGFEHYCDKEMPFDYAKERSFNFPFNGKMTQKDIGSFIASILQYNQLAFDQSFIDRLNEHAEMTESLALIGGLVFRKNDIEIGFSCCCDFEQWFDTYEEITQKEAIWMGHDPTPACNYKDESVTLIASADDENSPKIEFTQAEFVNAIESVKQDILGFMKIFADWAKQHLEHDSDRLIELMAVYLSVDRFDFVTPEG